MKGYFDIWPYTIYVSKHPQSGRLIGMIFKYGDEYEGTIESDTYKELKVFAKKLLKIWKLQRSRV